jgi:presenilin-like A22 family membrane protease
MEEPGVIIEHPNRDKASSKITRAIVVVLLLVSAGLVILISIGGWDVLEGAKALQVAYIVLYLVLAFFVMRWSRGVLPVIAALAIVLMIFAAVSAPAWFDRDKAGFTQPALDADILGLLSALLVPVQILLIAVAMSGFRQAWNVEVERHHEPPPDREEQRGPAPAAA